MGLSYLQNLASCSVIFTSRTESWLLDDVMLGGPVGTVASDVAETVNAGSKIGLSLNAAKCVHIAYPD